MLRVNLDSVVSKKDDYLFEDKNGVNDYANDGVNVEDNVEDNLDLLPQLNLVRHVRKELIQLDTALAVCVHVLQQVLHLVIRWKHS